MAQPSLFSFQLTLLSPRRTFVMLPVVHTYLPKLSPVEDYLKFQGRFRHLFEPTVQTEAIAHIQARVNAYWRDAKKTGTAS
jgi:pyruvate ferredoxin oxidoreductase beta subunit